MAYDPGRDYYISDRERAVIRRKWERKRKRNRLIRNLLKFCTVVLGLLIISLLVFGVFRIIKSNKYENVDSASKISGKAIELVENELVSSAAFLNERGRDSLKTDNDISSDELRNEAEEELPEVAAGSDTYVGESKGLVILDAGHGGYDGGAMSDTGLEKDINLSISLLAKDELSRRGYEVFLTRPEDEFVGLNKRAELANGKTEALCMVSIHQNSVDDHPEVSGVEAWTYERSGCIELADLLVNKVSEATGARNRGSFFRTNLVVTSKTTMPSVIIECGYLSNPDEALLLSTKDYQQLIVNGIADSVEEFISTYY